MLLMRTDPFRDIDHLTQRLLGEASRPATMPIDAYRDGDVFVVHFDLPGVHADSIDLEVERNVLTVTAERPDTVHDREGVVVAERPTGTFSRQLFLGETLETGAIRADYTDGVLTLRIPVAEQAKPRKISISRGDGQPRSIKS
ncbi:Hsp20/alpha crystallin family protein [Nocardiopsis sp. CNT312]|uniref:Hsp20/alpha crystallin family protein n=1 Tax=Nocardiopsis sp. CNT312 TaxID=1137268 RepID=UPI00049054EC|nr:Hsp20/alpha crystallin family protein [Nocardiopsis sp. CNT312]